MKLKKIFATAAFSLLIVSCNNDNAQKNLKSPTTETDKFSYSIGYDIANSFLQNLAADSIDLNVDYIYRGIADGLKSKDTTFAALMSKEERDQTMQDFQNMMQKKQEAKAAERKAKYEKRAKTAKEDGEKFLAENKNKPDVKTMPNGLQYKVITDGNGEIPKKTDRIKFHIVGKFIDGEEFQNTYTMPEAPEVALAELNLPAWQEALLKMKVGSKWEVYAPSELAYGEQDTGVIPPNSAVVFTIELLDIVKEDKNKDQAQEAAKK